MVQGTATAVSSRCGGLVFKKVTSSGEGDFMVGYSAGNNNTSNAAGGSYPFSHAAGHASMSGNALV